MQGAEQQREGVYVGGNREVEIEKERARETIRQRNEDTQKGMQTDRDGKERDTGSQKTCGV